MESAAPVREGQKDAAQPGEWSPQAGGQEGWEDPLWPGGPALGTGVLEADGT